DTLGVILYQEQIIEIAMYVAGMKPGRADGFRRAMTRHLNRVEMSSLEDEFIGGCLANEVPREVADQLFAAVQGFAVYGFCRSHAAAFARPCYRHARHTARHVSSICRHSRGIGQRFGNPTTRRGPSLWFQAPPPPANRIQRTHRVNPAC